MDRPPKLLSRPKTRHIHGWSVNPLLDGLSSKIAAKESRITSKSKKYRV